MGHAILLMNELQIVSYNGIFFSVKTLLVLTFPPHLLLVVSVIFVAFS